MQYVLLENTDILFKNSSFFNKSKRKKMPQ